MEEMKPRIFWHSPRGSRLVSGQDRMGSLISTPDLDLPLSILFLDSKTIFEDSSLAECKWKDVYTRAVIFLLQREELFCSFAPSKWWLF